VPTGAALVVLTVGTAVVVPGVVPGVGAVFVHPEARSAMQRTRQKKAEIVIDFLSMVISINQYSELDNHCYNISFFTFEKNLTYKLNILDYRFLYSGCCRFQRV
jgi:hypothetical protein